jgi:hypothetical protein
MSDIKQPFHNWINLRQPMKGLEASLSLSLSSELISPRGLLTSYLARNWTFFRSVEPSIYFRNLRKRKCTCWSQGTLFSNSVSLKSQTGGRGGSYFFFLILLPVPLQLLLWRKECAWDTHYIKTTTLYRVRRNVNLSWLSGPVDLHKLNSKSL